MKLMDFFEEDQAGSSLPLFVGLFCQRHRLHEGEHFFKRLSPELDLQDCAAHFPLESCV